MNKLKYQMIIQWSKTQVSFVANKYRQGEKIQPICMRLFLQRK
jgi:hypothetical protein